MIRPEIRERFRALVVRAIERSDREHAAHLATIRPEKRAGRGVAFRGSARKRPRLTAL